MFQSLPKIIMFILNFMLTVVMLKSRTQFRSSLKRFLKMVFYVFPTLQHSFDLNVNTIFVAASVNNSLRLWHSRFGHASFHTIKQILHTIVIYLFLNPLLNFSEMFVLNLNCINCLFTNLQRFILIL